MWWEKPGLISYVVSWLSPIILSQEQTMQNSSVKSFLKHNFSALSYLSLHVIVGFLLLVLSAWIFSYLAENVATNDPLVQFDSAVVNAIHANTRPTLVQLMLITSVAGNEVPLIVSLILGGYFAWKRDWDDLLLFVLVVGGAQLLDILFKNLFHRPRPLFVDPVTTAIGFSFPSGHAMGAFVFYGLLAYLLMRNNTTLLTRIMISLIFILVVGLIGFSRIYLGVHFPSDVLGGYIAGLAWLAFTTSGIHIYHTWYGIHRKKSTTATILG